MSSDFNSKCRTCLSESSFYHHIFDYVDEHSKIIEMLDILVPQINIKNTAQFSTLVCQICVEKLRSSYRFQQMCLETNNRLIELMGAANNVHKAHSKLENDLDSLSVGQSFIIKEEIEEDDCYNCALDEQMKSANDWLPDGEIELDSELRSKNNNGKNVSLTRKRISNDINPSIRVKEENSDEHLHNELPTEQEITEFDDGCNEVKNKYLEFGLQENEEQLPNILQVKEELDIDADQSYDQNLDDDLDNELFTKYGTKINERDDAIGNDINGIENMKRKKICEVCNKIFDRPCDLKRHSELHSLTRPSECKICKYRFADDRALKIHRQKHKNDAESVPKDFKCDVCQQKFITIPLFAKHMKNQHPEMKNHKCDQCSSSFILHESLIKHINHRHKGDKMLKCSKCEKIYESDYKLREHMRVHVRYNCPHCGKTCAGKGNLRSHIERHKLGVNRYLCPQCGKTFGANSNLRQHMKRHITLKTHQCPDCPQLFKCRSDLISHAAVHSNVKPYACEICGSCFTRKRSMQKHKKLHTSDRDFKCSQCNKTFKTNWALKCHMNIHTGEKPHVCKYCERPFSRSGDLNKHLRLHVGEKIYICDQCTMAFKYQVELRQHQMEHFKGNETHSQDELNMFDETQQDDAEQSTGTSTPTSS